MTITNNLQDWAKIIHLNILKEVLTNIPTNNICPKKEDVFKAFSLCSLQECKVIMLGQDPYPQLGKATGLLFGNNSWEENLSPSLRVIKKALEDPLEDLELDQTMEHWAKQGILLLNSALTTKVNQIGAHINEWRPFIVHLITQLCKYNTNYVFVLFGQQAQSFKPYINEEYHHVLIEKHPAFYVRTNSSMSRRVFDEVNNILQQQYGESIQWLKTRK